MYIVLKLFVMPVVLKLPEQVCHKMNDTNYVFKSLALYHFTGEHYLWREAR